MTGGSFRYLVRRGVTNLWLNKLMSLASVGILAACLVLIGASALISSNVNDIFSHIEDQNEMRVFLLETVTESEKSSIEKRLDTIAEIAEYRFIGKEEALEEAKDLLGDNASILDGYIDDNPLAVSYMIKLNDITKTRDIFEELSVMPGVEQVNAMNDVADTISGLERTIVIFGGIVVGILILASLIVIQNSIKLTAYARRREINIMKYVGATNAFIRLPFLVEGILVGLIAASFAFGILYGIYQGVIKIFDSSSILWVKKVSSQLLPFSSMSGYLALGFSTSGILLGSIG
ncbi:MAG: permease-like cell division protein FtsX, partial [Oscillospiraceae bacterium]|nr:permease-like cell division protein FtsX [Oscillospiraceae bacterium]